MMLQQGSTFLMIGLYGLAAGICLDIWLMTGKIYQFGKIGKCAGDLMYFVMAAAVFLRVLFTANGGVLRGYLFLGIWLGGGMYYVCLRRWLLPIWRWMLFLPIQWRILMPKTKQKGYGKRKKRKKRKITMEISTNIRYNKYN